jgi:hypothetical protein
MRLLSTSLVVTALLLYRAFERSVIIYVKLFSAVLCLDDPLHFAAWLMTPLYPLSPQQRLPQDNTHKQQPRATTQTTPLPRTPSENSRLQYDPRNRPTRALSSSLREPLRQQDSQRGCVTAPSLELESLAATGRRSCPLSSFAHLSARLRLRAVDCAP